MWLFPNVCNNVLKNSCASTACWIACLVGCCMRRTKDLLFFNSFFNEFNSLKFNFIQFNLLNSIQLNSSINTSWSIWSNIILPPMPTYLGWWANPETLSCSANVAPVEPPVICAGGPTMHSAGMPFKNIRLTDHKHSHRKRTAELGCPRDPHDKKILFVYTLLHKTPVFFSPIALKFPEFVYA